MKKLIALALGLIMCFSTFSALADNVISMNIVDTDKQNNDARYDYIKEKFGFDLEMVACSLNDIKEKARIWVAGADIPDVLWTDMSTPNFGEMLEWIDSGVLKPIDISKYPNIQKYQDAIQSDDALIVDGQRYFILTLRDNFDKGFMATERMIYRKDWAKELGLYNEGDVYTWEEMIEMAKAFVAKDPGKNGAGQTIGLASVGWAFPGMAGLQQMSPYWDTFFVKDGQYVWGGNQPETVEAVKMVKRLFDEGVIWADHALAQTLDGPSKFQAGQVGILYHNLTPNNIASVTKNLQNAYPDKDIFDMVGIMNVMSPDGNYFVKQTDEFWGNVSFRYDMDDELLDKFLSFIDFTLTPEGRDLIMYGLEGVDFNRAEDGTIECLWEKDEAGQYVSPYQINGDRTISIGMLAELAHYTCATDPETVRVIGAEVLWQASQDNLTYRELNIPFASFNAPNKSKYNMGAEARDKILELLVNSEDIEKDYLAWVDSVYESKVQLILDELNTGLIK